MSTDIPKHYDPAAAQQTWFDCWEKHGYFNADPTHGKPPHTIMIPLPNVTGALHMGHALNGTCQDLINRWKRMQGFEALWMPGTDHAGIATQAVVERRMLEEEGLTRHDIGREQLVNRIWRWKDAYEQRILSQLKTLGASCDWRRTRFTLDDVCSKAVRRTFFKLFRDGLIYRGKRLVNWDTYLQTAVADDEVYSEDVDGHFWTFNYPVVDDTGNPTGQKISFSTTRPETMLGDTAVCVHPKDDRYAGIVGKQVRIPLNGRLIPTIADGLLAKMEEGTGAVKVTPGHDPNDYACYQRNPEIGVINLLNPDGTFNEEAGEWQGLDRYKVREAVIERMAELGHYEGVEDRKVPIKHSDRSKTPIEPYLSDQWFVKMSDHDDGRPGLAQTAMDAVSDGRVTFFPARYAKTYLDWLGEKRDWCISRQLWWGHRIPIWTKRLEGLDEDLPGYAINRVLAELLPYGGAVSNRGISINEEFRDKLYATFAPGDPSLLLVCVDEGNPEIEAQLEKAGCEQDPDVLDTWFSSALWPHATLGWPDLEHDPPLDADEVAKQESAIRNPQSAIGSPGRSTINHQPSTGNAVLPYFYPHAEPADGNQSVLITSRDIITLWVARMVLTGLYNMGEIPFRHVHVHPKILDGFGQTMSKSKGNGVDPVDLIDKYGTDAIRFTIASFAGETQDVRVPISYECPHCRESIPQKLFPTETITYVVPETLQGTFPVGADGQKPRLRCPKCKETSQFSSPAYDPDPGEPVARTISERFDYGRNFCNKFWNAARFAMLNLEGYTPGPVAEADLQLEDRWVLSRLSTVAAQIDEYLARYQYDAATRTIRDFTWNEFCDWYLEMVKPRLKATQTDGSAVADDAEGVGLGSDVRTTAQRVLVGVLDTLIRLLQPFTPFICQELWSRLGELAPKRTLPFDCKLRIANCKLQNDETAFVECGAEEAAIIASWPSISTDWQDASLEKRFERLQETIVAVRNVRAENNIPPGTTLPLHVRCSADVADDLQNVADQFLNLAKVEIGPAGPDVERPAASASFALADAEGYIPLEGVIDVEAECARLQKEADKLRKHIAGACAKLANENFTGKAPADVVASVRETLASNQNQLASIEQIVRDLGG